MQVAGQQSLEFLDDVQLLVLGLLALATPNSTCAPWCISALKIYSRSCSISCAVSTSSSYKCSILVSMSLTKSFFLSRLCLAATLFLCLRSPERASPDCEGSERCRVRMSS